MPEEIFDVVDEQDHIIDQRPRAEVHRLGLRHRAAHVLIFNRAGELFLQKRSYTKECSPGLWETTVSGHLSAGEDYATAAVRETAEEAGLALPDYPEFLFKLAASPETGWEFIQIYRYVTAEQVNLDPEESEDGGWFSPEYIEQWIAARPEEFSTSFRLIWQWLKT